jgi:superoxide dismutase, Cu-Zn family
MRKLMALTLLALTSCASSQNKKGGEGSMKEIGPVPIEARSGSSLSGDVSLKEVAGGVEVKLAVQGAPPGKHGVHVHELGDCSAQDAKSAGDHFNPKGHPHGLPAAERRHLGDLGNMEVGEDGKGLLTFTSSGATLAPANELSFRGRSLIVHEKEDTGGQPSGDAGARIGCAVLGG